MTNPEQPRLEPRAFGAVAIVKGDKEWLLPPEAGPRVLAWYEHMMGHSEDRAQIYLAGVIDGLSAAWAERTRELLREGEALRREAEQTLGRERNRAILADRVPQAHEAFETLAGRLYERGLDKGLTSGDLSGALEATWSPGITIEEWARRAMERLRPTSDKTGI
jgi:hypothetical protein